MTNSEKIELLRLRLRALDKEIETLHLLEDTMKLMRSHSTHRAKLDALKRQIDDARIAYNEELDARTKTGFFGGYFARKAAVNSLRASKPALYGATHKMANVNLEAIRAGIDDLEALIGYDREDGVLLFNTMARRWASGMPLPAAAVVPVSGGDPTIRIGEHIVIKGALSHLFPSELQAFHLAILRYLRRIIQTQVGRALLRDLDKATRDLKRKDRDLSEDVVIIMLGSSPKDWACSCIDPEGATARGRPTIDSVPKSRGDRQGKQRGTGEGSPAFVKAYPTKTIEVGPGKSHPDNAWIPGHVALYHELIHALRGVTGKQDHTYLSERPSQLGDTFAHRGYWYTVEEKTTVAAEKEYSEQTGFNLKRVNYGTLAERIDK